jgi:predicted alpha/beta superfamily hydrolase
VVLVFMVYLRKGRVMNTHKSGRRAWLTALAVLLADPALAQMEMPSDWAAPVFSRSLGFEMTSRYTGQRYRVMLGLPHKAALPGGYPVLWALDGLASFPLMEVARPRPARVSESEQWRKKIGDEPAGLIVAVGYASGDPIDVNARALDYTPPTTGKTGDAFSFRHGGTEEFLRFLTLELRPLLARHFVMHPQQHTLFGFSYGGLFALHTLSTQPQHFQRYWAASPSLWFGEHHTMRMLPERLAVPPPLTHPVQVMVTVGLDEQYPVSFASADVQRKLQERTMVDNAQRFVQALNATGSPVWQAQFQAVAGHDHQDMLFHGARRVVDFAFAP